MGKSFRSKGSFLLLLGVLAGLTLFFYQFLYLPQQAELEEKRQQVTVRLNALNELEEFTQQHADLAAYETALKDHARWGSQLLPERLNTGDFLSELQIYMLRTKIRITGLKPSPPERNEGFFQQKIELGIEGDYFQILDFLRLLEQGTRFTNMKNVSGEVKERGIFSGHIDLYIFARQNDSREEGK